MDSIPSCWASRSEQGGLPWGGARRGRLPVPQGVPAAAGQRRRGQHRPPGPSFPPSRKNHLPHPPLTKQELGSGLGRASCAMLALTDVGFAAAVAEKLAQLDPEAYGPAWETLSNKAARVKKFERKSAPHKTRARAGPENESRTPIQRRAAKGMDKRRSHTLR